MEKCEHCGTELKALFTSTYCPNECKVNVAGLEVLQTRAVEWDGWDNIWRGLYDEIVDVRPLTDDEVAFSVELCEYWKWPLDVIQAYQTLDAEAELIKAFTEDMAREINLELEKK